MLIHIILLISVFIMLILAKRSHKHLLWSVIPVCSHLVKVVSRVFVTCRSTSPYEGWSTLALPGDGVSGALLIVNHAWSSEPVGFLLVPAWLNSGLWTPMLDCTGPPRGRMLCQIVSPMATIEPGRPPFVFALHMVTHAVTMIHRGLLSNVVPADPTC